MKQTSDTLELREMFGSLNNLLVGGSFIVFGLCSGSFFGYLFAALGLLLVIFMEIEIVTFDKNLGHVTIDRQKPLIFKRKVVKHQIQDISGVEIQQIESNDSILDNDSIPSKSIRYRVCLVLKSGKWRVPLTSSFSTGLGGKQKKAQVIATFLNIKNYGLEGFPRQISSELKWKTIEEEIVYWKTAIENDSNDADAHMKLAFALVKQDKAKNKEQAIGYLKQAEAMFKTQGYDEEAMQARQVWSIMW
jgi:hypothetical protein